jgi:hypothetical protein
MSIIISTIAEKHLERGYHFYESQELGIGDYFLNTLYSEIDSLHLYAGIHPTYFKKYRMLSKTFPYANYYTMHENTIEVRAILDLRRNPHSIKNQLRNP